MGLQRAGHNWATNTHFYYTSYYQQPPPVTFWYFFMCVCVSIFWGRDGSQTIRGGNYPAGWKSPKTRLTTNLWSGIPTPGGNVPAQVQVCTYSRSSTGRPAPHRASYFKVSTLKALKLDQHHKVFVKACFRIFFFFSFSWRLPSNYCNGSTQTEGWQAGGPAFTLNFPRSCTQSLAHILVLSLESRWTWRPSPWEEHLYN